MSPFSARSRWSRSRSASALRFCAASWSAASAVSASVNDFFTWKTTSRRTSATSYSLTREAARALSRRRRRLPPVSSVWPTVSVCSMKVVPPYFSLVKAAVGLGMSPAVISLARVASSS